MFERFTDDSRRSVVMAQEEARALKHKTIDVQHLLLGMCHPECGIAPSALASLGVSLEAAREQVKQRTRRGFRSAVGHLMLTDRTKVALELSLTESLQLGHEHIGSEHLLLALVAEGTRSPNRGRRARSGACETLEALGVDLAQVRPTVLPMLAASSRPNTPAASGQTSPSQQPRQWPTRFYPKGEDPA